MAATKIVNPQNQFGQNLAVENLIQSRKSFWHSFSRIPLNTSEAISNSTTPAGHTISTSQVWAEEIPAFVELNRLCPINEYPFKINDIIHVEEPTPAYYRFTGEEFEEVAIVDGTVLLNAKSEPVVKVHINKPVTVIKYENDSEASAISAIALLQNEKPTPFVDSINVKTLNRPESTGYRCQVLEKGTLLTEGLYIDYYNGIVLTEQSTISNPDDITINCFEYIGKTLNTVIDNLSASHDYEVLPHSLTDEEKVTGQVLLHGRKALIDVSLGSLSLMLPVLYNPATDTLTVTIFDSDVDSVSSVYDGLLESTPLTFILIK